jgi:hypothetical protein
MAERTVTRIDVTVHGNRETENILENRNPFQCRHRRFDIAHAAG